MDQAERSKFQTLISASHEAMERLDRYAALLVEWSEKFNLVAPSTLPHIWNRHFLDSAQLYPLIPKGRDGQIVADLGSGAGFPGLVLSMLGIPNVNLIESTGKKADFLRFVINDLGLDATVRQNRIKDIMDLRADIITARALAPLKELLPLAMPLLRKNTICLFLKGQNADVELTEAQKYWMFGTAKQQSLSDPSGSVLIIKNLMKNAKSKSKSHHT